MTPLFSVQRNKQYREIYAQLFYDPSLSKTNISKGKKDHTLLNLSSMTKQIVWLKLYYISSSLAMCKGNDIFFFLTDKNLNYHSTLVALLIA
jgi:hypothetical protein